jgi:hypothetical protein
VDIDCQDYRFQFDRRSTGDSDSQQGIWSPVTGPFGFRFLGRRAFDHWAVGSFFGNTELSLELWPVIHGISSFDD